LVGDETTCRNSTTLIPPSGKTLHDGKGDMGVLWWINRSSIEKKHRNFPNPKKKISVILPRIADHSLDDLDAMRTESELWLAHR